MEKRSILVIALFFLCVLIINFPVSAASETFISIYPIGDKHVGDKFTITAQTNIPEGIEVFVQVYDLSGSNGASGTVKVTKNTGGMNKIAFNVDAATFIPGEYKVFVFHYSSASGDTTQFNILDNKPPTVVLTPQITSVKTISPVISSQPPESSAPLFEGQTFSIFLYLGIFCVIIIVIIFLLKRKLKPISTKSFDQPVKIKSNGLSDRNIHSNTPAVTPTSKTEQTVINITGGQVHIGNASQTTVKDSVLTRSNVGNSNNNEFSVCSNCGEEIGNNSKWCTNCGKKLK